MSVNELRGIESALKRDDVLHAVTTIVAARIAARAALGTHPDAFEVAEDFEEIWPKVVEGIRRGREAEKEAYRARKAQGV